MGGGLTAALICVSFTQPSLEQFRAGNNLSLIVHPSVALPKNETIAP
jgi:hypothetical protein